MKKAEKDSMLELLDLRKQIYAIIDIHDEMLNTLERKVDIHRKKYKTLF